VTTSGSAALWFTRFTAALCAIVALGAAPARAGGWYLLIAPMVPPYDEPNDTYPWLQTNAPLSKWTQVRSFDTAEACEAGKTPEMSKAVQGAKEIEDRAGIWATLSLERRQEQYYLQRRHMIALLFSQCVVSDDPRLK